MNISPHHQKPTRYPWPGIASVATMVIGLGLILLIGFMLISDSPAPDDGAPDATGMQGTEAAAERGFG